MAEAELLSIALDCADAEVGIPIRPLDADFAKTVPNGGNGKNHLIGCEISTWDCAPLCRHPWRGGMGCLASSHLVSERYSKPAKTSSGACHALPSGRGCTRGPWMSYEWDVVPTSPHCVQSGLGPAEAGFHGQSPAVVPPASWMLALRCGFECEDQGADGL